MLLQSEQSQGSLTPASLTQQVGASGTAHCSKLPWASFYADITPLISPWLTTPLQYASGSMASEAQAGSNHPGLGFGTVG